MISYIWVMMVGVAFVAGAVNGELAAVGSAALEGASAAVTLCLGIAGPICLWSGLMALLQAGRVTEKLARLLSPVLHRLFPSAREDAVLMEKISANVSANILGLGNAATPLGMAAAQSLGARCRDLVASNELCRLVVLNTASLQLIPATVAAVRASAGAAAPFDILPAVWISSFAGLAAGLLTARFCEQVSAARLRRVQKRSAG